MKIEVNVQKKYFFVFLGAMLIIGAGIFAYAYNNPPTGGDSSIFGHSVNEIDWNQTIPQVNANTLNATTRICINGDCKISWPLGGSTITLPLNCPNGDVLQGINATGGANCTTAPTPDVSACSARLNEYNCFAGCANGKTPISTSGDCYVTRTSNGYTCSAQYHRNTCTCYVSCA